MNITFKSNPSLFKISFLMMINYLFCFINFDHLIDDKPMSSIVYAYEEMIKCFS